MPRAARKARRRGGKGPGGPGQGVSLRALALRLGVSHPAVVKAIKSGRLARSVRLDQHGRPSIVDADLAAREWEANATQRRRSKPEPAPPAGEPQEGEPLEGLVGRSKTLVEAQLKVTDQRALSLSLKNRERQRELVEAERVERDSFDTARIVRESMLAIPDRLSSELAAEKDATKVHARLDEEIRLALATLADIFARAEAGDADCEPGAGPESGSGGDGKR